MAHFPQNKGIFALFSNISKSIHMSFKILVHAIECTRKGGFPMKETTPPKDPKKKLWIGYTVIIAILFALSLIHICNICWKGLRGGKVYLLPLQIADPYGMVGLAGSRLCGGRGRRRGIGDSDGGETAMPPPPERCCKVNDKQENRPKESLAPHGSTPPFTAIVCKEKGTYLLARGENSDVYKRQLLYCPLSLAGFL